MFWHRLDFAIRLGQRFGSPRARAPYRARLTLEPLESRLAPATASLSNGVLTVVGRSIADTITISRSTAGILKLNGAPVAGPNGNLTVGQTNRVVVLGGGGNDTITMDDTNGKLPKATLKGGADNDTLIGSAAQDKLFGGLGDDTLQGRGDIDQMLGEDGLDVLVWNPGDGNDVMEGGTGSDTLQFNGSAGAEIFTVSANGARLLATRNVGAVALDINDVETVDVNALGGADTINVNDLTGTAVTSVNIDLGVNAAGDAAVDNVIVNGTGAIDVIQAVAVNGVQVTGLTAQVNITQSEAANDILTVNGLGGNDTLSGSTGLLPLIKLTLDGGDGSDTLNGGNGADTLIGGDGDDTIDGNGGNDTAFMGNGNDTFVWDPGDGSDVVEGQAGTDTLRFNGAPGAEIFAASSNGGSLLFTRNVGNIVMDVDDVEILNLNAVGGIDTITINDLAATDVTSVNIDLGVNGAGDASADAVTVNGTAGVDVMNISGSAGSVTIDTSAVIIAITNAETANDTLTINTSGGADLVSASGLASTSVKLLTINAGSDDDLIVGSQGNDTINGDAGNDVMFGGAGNDTFTGGTETDLVFGGAGNDIDGGGIETFNQ